MKATAHWIVLLTCVPFVANAPATEWHVAVNGSPAGQGTRGSPWDMASALGGIADGQPLRLLVPEEFAAFVLLK